MSGQAIAKISVPCVVPMDKVGGRAGYEVTTRPSRDEQLQSAKTILMHPAGVPVWVAGAERMDGSGSPRRATSINYERRPPYPQQPHQIFSAIRGLQHDSLKDVAVAAQP